MKNFMKSKTNNHSPIKIKKEHCMIDDFSESKTRLNEANDSNPTFNQKYIFLVLFGIISSLFAWKLVHPGAS